MDRREFINISFLTSGGLVLGLSSSFKEISVLSSKDKRQFLFTPFLRISNEGAIIIYVPVPEIGQGVRTALPMILAEELDADWSDISIEQAIAADNFGNMSAAGSTSIQRFYEPLRKSGAIAREMLKTAGGEKWNIGIDHIKTEKSFLINTISGERIPYSEVVEHAASLPIPDVVKIKDSSEFKIIGNSRKSLDLHDIVTGKATYGIDTVIPGMKYVAIERCPVRGGKLLNYDAQKALAVDGVINVIEVKHYMPTAYAEVLPGVAVIAESTASALKGKNYLSINWDFGETSKENNESYRHQFNSIKDQPPSVELRNEGDFQSEIEKDDKVINFEYEIPFWAHYCMEPMNFTAHFNQEKCLLIGPNQRPQLIQDLVSQIYKIPIEKVEVQTTLTGGGFGRRLAVDYALEALIVSKDSGYPVKVIWTREDDVLHDYFRTINFHHLKIGLRNKKINSWYHHIITKPIGDGPIYEVQGAADLPFEIPNINIGYSPFQTKIRIGSWRSVAHSYNSFVVNNTITEIAAELSKDPLDLYLELIGVEESKNVKLPLRGSRGNVTCDLKRFKNVLLKAAELSEWKTSTNGHTAKGIAAIFYKDSYSAHVAEVSNRSGEIELIKITAVIDCGKVINPSGIYAQMEGSISDAISVTLKSGIKIKNGQPQEINFDRHAVTYYSDMPELQLHIMNSDHPPVGAGEPPFPSVPPAISNAIFRLTGKKNRTLPINF